MTRNSSQDGFFLQSLNGDYRSYSEDRPTQLCAACINHSDVFRRGFFKFLGLSKGRISAEAKAETQMLIWRRGDYRRLDLVISLRGRIVAVV
jgi:hypothetical protein